LDELNFRFNIIGVTETKITNSNSVDCCPTTPGYNFEHIPTLLASGGVGMFIDETLNYKVLGRISNEAFQALWIEISFVKKNKKIIDLKTALLNEAGLERIRCYFCRCVVANAKERAIYCFSVSVSDYILCIAWV